MPQLAERQRSFAAALLDPDLPAPIGILGPDGDPGPRRFAVYRNNVVVGLAQTLKDAFPAVHRIVGTDFFRMMASAYARREPPRSPILLDYGGTFPDFIRQFEPAAMLPYLADVASIERAWAEAYHAVEASPIDPLVFLLIEADRLATMRLYLHPSLRIVRSRFPALTIWQMNIAGGTVAPVDLAAAEHALIVRPFAEVEVRSIPKDSLEFIEALAGGCTVAAALQMALMANARFDLAANLADLMRAGAVVGYGLEEVG